MAAHVPDWIDEIDLSVGDVHVRMGTRSLPEDAWLSADEHATTEIALRRRLLSEQRDLTFACTPLAQDPATELAHLIDRWHETHPAPALPPSGESHPLARASSLVQEDLCLMVHHHGAWRLEGAALCFPSLWILGEKMGQPTADVHQPVAHYARELSQRVDTFFDRLAPGKLVWRRNFSLWPTLLLWVPCHTLDPSLVGEPPFRHGRPTHWLRSERQTLRRLPDTGAIAFTIKVQMMPIALMEQRPDRARELADWLRSPAGHARWDLLGESAEPLVDWLLQTAKR